MKFAHLSDLHLGISVNGFSMIEDQKYILNDILDHLVNEKVDGLLLSGDLYDNARPSAEAVKLFDGFLYALAGRNIDVYVIYGNHDSPERIAYGARLFKARGVYVSPVYDGTITTIQKEDAFGELYIHLIPFLRPADVRRFFPEEEIESYEAAMQTVLSHLPMDLTKRNIVLVHQFVTGAKRSDSERISVGGTDNMDRSIFSSFDYVALGHIHKPQTMLEGKIRYCGSPLKYSFSEANVQKSITVVELMQKGDISLKCLPLVPMRDLRVLRGSFAELTESAEVFSCDYLRIILTDEEEIPEVLGKLREHYPNIMTIEYDNRRTAQNQQLLPEVFTQEVKPVDIVNSFFELQNNREMNPKERAKVANLIEEIWGGAI